MKTDYKNTPMKLKKAVNKKRPPDSGNLFVEENKSFSSEFPSHD